MCFKHVLLKTLQSVLLKVYLRVLRNTHESVCLSTLKWPFHSLKLYYLEVQFFKNILLIFEIHYKCTFNTLEHTFGL